MTWNYDKHTSWHALCIYVILNSDLYINIVWVQDKLDLCTKTLWTWSYNWSFAIKQIGYGWILLSTYTLTRIIVLEVTIYVYDSKQIIHWNLHSSKDRSLEVKCIKMTMITGLHTWTMNLIIF